MPRIDEVDEDGGPSYPVITGDYDAAPAGSRAGQAGTPLSPPTPLFTKLDPSIVDEELARLEGRDPAPQRYRGPRPVRTAARRRPGAAAGQAFDSHCHLDLIPGPVADVLAGRPRRASPGWSPSAPTCRPATRP